MHMGQTILSGGDPCAGVVVLLVTPTTKVCWPLIANASVFVSDTVANLMEPIPDVARNQHALDVRRHPPNSLRHNEQLAFNRTLGAPVRFQVLSRRNAVRELLDSPLSTQEHVLRAREQFSSVWSKHLHKVVAHAPGKAVVERHQNQIYMPTQSLFEHHRSIKVPILHEGCIPDPHTDVHVAVPASIPSGNRTKQIECSNSQIAQFGFHGPHLLNDIPPVWDGPERTGALRCQPAEIASQMQEIDLRTRKRWRAAADRTPAPRRSRGGCRRTRRPWNKPERAPASERLFPARMAGLGQEAEPRGSGMAFFGEGRRFSDYRTTTLLRRAFPSCRAMLSGCIGCRFARTSASAWDIL